MKWRGLAILLLCAFASPGYGYKLSGNSWTAGYINFYTGMPGVSPSGTPWSQSLQSAMAQWTNQTAFEFRSIAQYHDPCIKRGTNEFGDGVTSADFGTTACGKNFDNNVLAITLTAGVCFKSDCTTGFDINDADIIFNSNITWDVYSGERRANATDFGRVALHELGHAIGLGHEDVNNAIMQATVSNIHTLQQDDINGANAIYGSTAGRDDLSANILSSIYGISVIIPANNTLGGASTNGSLTGALGSGDALLNNRYIDIFQYTLTQDTQMDLRMESSGFNALLYLARVDSTQQTIDAYTFTDDNSGGNLNARILRNIPAGTYWIGATSASGGQLGGYTLSFTTGNGSPPVFDSYVSKYGIPVQINPNPSISGSLGGTDKRLDSGTYIDIYEFTVRQSITLQIDLSSSTMDTMLYLARLTGNQDLDSNVSYQNNNGGVGTNSRLIRTLPPGTYWIGASSFAADTTGNYSIAISVIP